MMDLFYTVFTFLGGLIGGVLLTAYKYRNYIKVGFESMVEAWKDGKLDVFDAVYLLVKVHSVIKEISEQNSALEIIQFIKQRFNLQ